MALSTFQAIKWAIVTATGLERDALHIYVGLVVFFMVAIVFKKPLRSPLPWLAVLLVAIVGELFDLRDDLAIIGHWRWKDSLHDIINTQFWPAVLCLLTRYTNVFNATKASAETLDSSH
jgi:hypothetical protein